MTAQAKCKACGGTLENGIWTHALWCVAPTSKTLTELHASAWHEVKGRGKAAIIEGDYSTYDPNTYKGQNVMVDGVEYLVTGVETFAVPRSEDHPYHHDFGLILTPVAVEDGPDDYKLPFPNDIDKPLMIFYKDTHNVNSTIQVVRAKRVFHTQIASLIDARVKQRLLDIIGEDEDYRGNNSPVNEFKIKLRKKVSEL